MDIEYLLWLQGIRESSAPFVRELFRFLGGDGLIAVMLPLVCLAYWCLDRDRGMLAVLGYGYSGVTNQLIKNTVCCYRPWVRDPRIVPEASAIPGASGYSFPSGHSQSAASMLGGLGWLWRERRWPLVLSAAVVFLIAFSRNFLGVHTPQDVIVGISEGILAIWLTGMLFDWVDAEEGRDLRLLVVTILVSVAYLLYVTLKPYPVEYVDGQLLVDPAEMLVDCYKTGGVLIGTIVGWFVERRWIRFSTDDVAVAQGALRMVVGLVLVVVVYVPLGHAFVAVMGPLWGQLVRHLLSLFTATALAPMAFVEVERRVLSRTAPTTR